MTKILSKYPNAVAFSGHSHSPLNDERNFWQDKFTSVGTSSLSYLYPMPARENTYQDDWGAKPPTQMANIGGGGRQGMVMKVYDGAIVFDRREFVNDQPVADPWVMPLPISLTAPLTFENRKKTAPVPQFPEGTKVTVSQALGRDRYGVEQQQVTVTFPNVLKKDTGVRAFDYEVQVEHEWLDCRFISVTIYGGTFNLFGVTLKKLGIECTFVNADAPEEEIDKAFRPNTKALFGETISNPSIDVLDIEKFARIAHKHGVPLIVDNTFATPINCRPFEWGADIVTHSTTKYMDGHATSVGGAIVDSGNFDWEAHADKFPGLTQPDESYHGLTYTKAFGKMAYMTKATAQLMRDLGSIQSPQNAFLLNLGLETLHLRVPRHCENAQKVAEWLEANPQVKWVNYCGLKSSKYYELAQKYMPNGSCGVIAFGLNGSREEAIKFMDALKLACIVTHVADARTCVLHPASHTHRQLTDEQLMEAGVAPDLIRLSVGIEDANDIIADLEQALEQIK